MAELSQDLFFCHYMLLLILLQDVFLLQNFQSKQLTIGIPCDQIDFSISTLPNHCIEGELIGTQSLTHKIQYSYLFIQKLTHITHITHNKRKLKTFYLEERRDKFFHFLELIASFVYTLIQQVNFLTQQLRGEDIIICLTPASMQAYSNIVKTLYSTGKDYLWNMTEKAKQPMIKVDKTATIYEAKCFHQSRVDPKRCISILAKLIYLFNQGESFTQDETTSLFFAITKLFQIDDPQLRRLIYTFVKQMSDQPSIYIVTSSLLKDIHHKDCNYRRNSLRTLPVVLDSSNLVQVERYIKQLMNDSDPGVVSSALLAGLHMYSTNQQVVKKWGVEVGQKLKSKDKYVQFHALALIGQIKKKDTKFLKKALQAITKQSPTGLYGIQHLRMLKLIVEQSQFDAPEVSGFINFILKQTKSSDDNIVIQAAKIACQSSFFSNKELLEVVKILERFLVSESTAKKYTVLKLYNSLLKNSSRKNLVVNVKQIQKVLKDKNINLSATAASILLRICSENYLEMLLKSLSKTMSQMSIEYKVDVVKSLVNVLTTYPKQYLVINQFIFQILKEQQSQELRREAIQVMSYEITQIGGEAKVLCLQEIAKFLSFAKYQKIHFQILGIINREIRKEDVTSDLLKSLIHQIYLQEGSIRACGLSTLMKISDIYEDKRAILERTIAKFEKDRDQQIRQRVIFRSKVEKISSFELDMIEGYLFHNCQAIQNSKDAKILSIEKISKWGEEMGSSILKKKKKVSTKHQQIEKQRLQQQKHYKDLFLNHSTFKGYGTLRKINERVLLSDSDAELQVNARVFLFEKNLVLMFEIENKFEKTILQNVKVEVKHSGEEYQTQHVIPAKQIEVNGKGQTYVGLTKNEDSEQLLSEEVIEATVKFVAKLYSGGEQVKATYQDQFSLQKLEIKGSNYISHWQMQSSEFESNWSKTKGQSSEQTYQLNYASKQAAIQELTKKFGMTCISSQESKNGRTNLCLAGKYLGNYKTLLKIAIGFDTKLGCIAKANAISQRQGLAEEIIQSIA